MMPILDKSDDVRSGRKAEVRHGRLRAAQESMGQFGAKNRSPASCMAARSWFAKAGRHVG